MEIVMAVTTSTVVVVGVMHIVLQSMDGRNANVCGIGGICESDGGGGSGCGGRNTRGYAFNSGNIL